jgi:hypothetical protein
VIEKGKCANPESDRIHFQQIRNLIEWTLIRKESDRMSNSANPESDRIMDSDRMESERMSNSSNPESDRTESNFDKM